MTADVHYGRPYFFLPPKVLNDRLFVLLLLKVKFSGGIHHEGRTETTDHCPAPGWGGVWEHSQPIGAFHQHREIFLPAAQPGSEAKGIRLRAVRQGRQPEPGAETEAVLLRCLPEQVVERPSGTGEAESGLHLHLPDLRERVYRLRKPPPEVLFPCLLHCLPVQR